MVPVYISIHFGFQPHFRFISDLYLKKKKAGKETYISVAPTASPILTQRLIRVRRVRMNANLWTDSVLGMKEERNKSLRGRGRFHYIILPIPTKSLQSPPVQNTLVTPPLCMAKHYPNAVKCMHREVSDRES